jgi:hypothetical protein
MCCKSACFHLSAGRDVDLYNSVLISLVMCQRETLETILVLP